MRSLPRLLSSTHVTLGCEAAKGLPVMRAGSLLSGVLLLVGCASSAPRSPEPPAPVAAAASGRTPRERAFLEDWNAGKPHLVSLPERMVRCEPPEQNFYDEVFLRCNEALLEFRSEKQLFEALEGGLLEQKIALAELKDAPRNALLIPAALDLEADVSEQLPGLWWDSRGLGGVPWQFSPKLSFRDDRLVLDADLGHGELRALPGGFFRLTTATPPLTPQEVDVPTLPAAFAHLQQRALEAYWERIRSAEEAQFRAEFEPIRIELAQWKATGFFDAIRMGGFPRGVVLLPRRPIPRSPRGYIYYAPPRPSPLEILEDAEESRINEVRPGKHSVFRFRREDGDERPLMTLRDGKVISVSKMFSLRLRMPPERRAFLCEPPVKELAETLGMSWRRVAHGDDSVFELQGGDEQIRLVVAGGFVGLKLSVAREETARLKAQALRQAREP